MIRFHYHINPDELDDDTWAKYSKEIIFNLKFNGVLKVKEK